MFTNRNDAGGLNMESYGKIREKKIERSNYGAGPSQQFLDEGCLLLNTSLNQHDRWLVVWVW